MTRSFNGKSAWSTSLIQSLLSFFCAAVLAYATAGKISQVSMSFTIAAVINLFCALVLLFNIKDKSEKLSLSIYLINILCVGLMVFYNQEFWLASDPTSNIFFGYKAMAVIVALQGPRPKWVGLVSLNFLFGLSLFQFYSWPLNIRESLSVQEPWFTFVLVMSCQFIYLQRIKIYEIVQKNLELEISTQQLRQFAEILLGVQHIINSPLQVIESSNDLIEIKHPEAKKFSQKIKNATSSIKKVSQLLSLTKSHLHWNDFKLVGGTEELQDELEILIKRLNTKSENKSSK